jgi:uncharacterized membrane protein
MAEVEKSIVVDVPVSTCYNQWTQFESFPQFMEGVQEVRQLDDKHLHWRAQVGGKQKEWDAEIVEQVPDQVIAWKSTEGPENDGTVRFQQEGQGQTRVNLHIVYDPEGVLESVGSLFGMAGHRVEGDLERFKHFIEERGEATGAWRGEVPPDRPLRPENEARSA